MNYCLQSFCLLFHIFLINTDALPTEVYDPRYQYVQEGDLNIGAILSIHSSNKGTVCSGNVGEFRYVKYAEAIHFAINKINSENILLPNITLGFVVLDDCFLSSLALARAIQFMPLDCRDCSTAHHLIANNAMTHNSSFYDVVGVLGAYTSQLTVTVANVLSLFKIPQISHTATSDVLSNKKQFPYFFRMVPPDKYQVQVMSHVLSYFNWTYVSLVYSEGSYGRGGIKRLKTYLKSPNSNICIAEEIEVQKDTSELEFQTIIKRLKSHGKAKVIVLFVEVENARVLLKAADSVGMEDYFFVSSDSLSQFFNTNPKYCGVTPGTLSVRPYSKDIDIFEQYILSEANSSMTTNKWFRAYLNRFNITASLSNREHDTDNDSDTHSADADDRHASLCQEEGMINSDFAASLLVDSVYAYAYAIRHVLQTKCKHVRKKDIRKCVRGVDIAYALADVRFDGSFGEIMFDSNGDVMGKYEIRQCQILQGKPYHHVIGEWDMRTRYLSFSETPKWKNTDKPPESSCAEPCIYQVGRIYHFTKETCCWDCIPCKNNEIVIDNATRCKACDIFLWPDDVTHRECVEIVAHHVTISHAVSIGFCSASFVGISLCLCVLIIFARYRSERIIRTTNRELSHVMLVGVFLAYILIFCLMNAPNKIQCFINYIGFNLTFTFIYAPLLVKTTRIYRIFEAGKRTTILPPCTSSSSQVCIAIALITFQVSLQTIIKSYHYFVLTSLF